MSYGKKDGRGKREQASERYKDRASELVMNLVECVNQQCLFGIDSDVAYQLTTRGIDEGSMDGGKLKNQTKKKWREANGGQSPDEMDAVAVIVSKLLEQGILKPGRDTRTMAVPQFEDWMMPKKPAQGSMRGHRKVVNLVRRW